MQTIIKRQKTSSHITYNGENCLKVYNQELQNVAFTKMHLKNIQPFGTVILDYKTPKINGMEVAKEILAINPHQRIIFASAYVQETLIDSVKKLKQIVVLLQKLFGEQILIDAKEDKEIYTQLEKLNVSIDYIKAADFRHEQLRDTSNALNKIHNKENR